MKGRTVTLILAILLVASLAAGCAQQAATTEAPATEAPAAAPTEAPPAEPTEAPAPAGVTALQVQQLLAEKFNTADRDLTLWNIQPGLGTVMIEYGRRIALAYLAAQAGDWGMAQYQLKEAVEIQEVGETTRPGKADALAAFEHAYLDPLAEDIQAKDLASFNDDFDTAVTGCNACHASFDKAFVVFQPPANSPEAFLKFEASDPEEPEGESEHPAAAAAPDTPLTWEELYQMVDEAFNTADRSLALWNIQPGLGTVMMEYGRRFAMVNEAVDAGNWGMAQYQLKEAIEIQEVGETTRPGNAEMLSAFEHGYLDTLMADIEAKDAAAFAADYAGAIEGCNACHQATGHPYVRFQMSTTPAQPFLAQVATDPGEHEEESAASPAAQTYPEGTPTLDDAQQLIEERFNNIDRSLALWNIQPGLGTVMMEYGRRFALAWQAAEAGNWGMAEYQMDEAIEIQEVGETTRPGKADMLSAFEHGYLDDVLKAIEDQDKAGFETSMEAAVGGCNACHTATGHPYVVVDFPPTIAVDYLNLK